MGTPRAILTFGRVRVLAVDSIAVPDLAVGPVDDDLATAGRLLDQSAREFLSSSLGWCRSRRSLPVLDLDDPVVSVLHDVCTLALAWHRYFSRLTPLKGL